MKRVVRLLRVILSVGKVEFWVCMGGMVVVGGDLAGGLGLGDTVEVLVSVLIGLLHWCRCFGVGIVVGLSEGGIVVVGVFQLLYMYIWTRTSARLLLG